MSLSNLPYTITSLHPLRAEINLDALRKNWLTLQAIAGEAKLLAVVKANAYGHGSVRIAKELIVLGADRLAVANLLEGIELREAGIDVPILVLSAPLNQMLGAYARYRLGVTVSSVDVARAVADTASSTGPLTVHVKVDTGMTRLGLLPGEVAETLELLRRAKGVHVEGILTHYATVDHDFTLRQSSLFDDLVDSLEDPPRLIHGANSGTLLYTPETVRGKALVRVGGALFGLLSPQLEEAASVQLQPVMKLVSRVVHLRDIEAGTSVSYGRTWIAEQSTRIATIAAGYGDGLPRSLSNSGEVGIKGKRYPIVGRVCMDMFMVDLGQDRVIQVGEEVVLFGPGGPSAVEAAGTAGTIAYDLTTGLTPRVPRVYVG
ncbi:MAG: alanine racemase [Rubricoccaceae bacterium]|nr:alanine racemase [Rubricoccaceae bacterium]